MNRCIAVNIQDILISAGEESLRAILSSFVCPQNKEIEEFVQKNSIDFARRKLSVTYLILQKEDCITRLLGIFTLTHKSVQVSAEKISGTVRKKMSRYSRLDKNTGEFNVSAFLIAQFGKNYGVETVGKITGNEMMARALEILSRVQYEIGGGIVYLECEDRKKLLDFYQNEENRFRIFSERESDMEDIKYIQLMRII